MAHRPAAAANRVGASVRSASAQAMAAPEGNGRPGNLPRPPRLLFLLLRQSPLPFAAIFLQVPVRAIPPRLPRTETQPASCPERCELSKRNAKHTFNGAPLCHEEAVGPTLSATSRMPYPRARATAQGDARGRSSWAHLRPQSQPKTGCSIAPRASSRACFHAINILDNK